MEQKSKTNYRSYVLTAKSAQGIKEIDWTKLKGFEEFKKEKYKLERIDFFTRHFVDDNELINKLINADVLTIRDFHGARLWIYPAIQSKGTQLINGRKKSVSSPIYAPEHLQYGLAYKDLETFFNSDAAVILFLQSKITDVDFVTQLFNKYGVYGKYTDYACETLKGKINTTENIIDKMQRNGEDYSYYSRVLKSFYKQYRDIATMYGLLVSVRNFAVHYVPGDYMLGEDAISAQNNIREFFLREKYNVISCTDGLNDDRALTFEVDNAGNPKINYLKFHNFIMFISNFNSKKEEKPKRKINIQAGGQISMF